MKIKRAIDKCSSVALSKLSGTFPYGIGGQSGYILQTGIMEIQDFSRCLISITQGNMHTFSRFSNKIFANKREIILMNKTMYIILILIGLYTKSVFFTGIICASYDLGDPG